MKRIIALLLSIVITLVFSACKSESNGYGDSYAKDTDAALGGIDGAIYTNKSVGIQLLAPAGWIFYNQSEMVELNNNVTDLDEANTMFDMMVVDKSGNNLSLAIENLEKLYGSFISTDSYIDLTIEKLESASAFSNIKVSNITIAGEKWKCIKSTRIVSDKEVDQISAIKKHGKYLVLITATGVTQSPQSLFKMFTEIDESIK